MHDPNTAAFEIRYPWWAEKPWPKKHRKNLWRGNSHVWNHRMSAEEKVGRSSHWPNGYRSSFITIWHVDPERDGVEDSCGYSHPNLTDKQLGALWSYSWFEARDPYFLKVKARKWEGPLDVPELLERGLLLRVAQLVGIRLSFDDAAKRASMVIHRPDCTSMADTYVYEPGYHSNNEADREEDRREHFFGILCSRAKFLLAERRPWWRHPRWHVWHWRIQCHPLQQFKRWVFSRCAECGKRFKYGESPISSNWEDTGPSWFRSETGIRHQGCYADRLKPQEAAEARKEV